ncbi:hypothetical protein ACIA5D_09270 [Actinoplanes sp. NPDC051513]|uniref:hypothetical protein n=1 Tax=Actinoplanes sp. NPDC051513 TaxID=3363908 RepID=UPI0037A7ABBC
MPHAPVLGDFATPATVMDADTGVGEIEANVLREAGFDVLQGYHFGRPVPSRETVPRAA